MSVTSLRTGPGRGVARYISVMDVSEVSAQLGVSPRRVRALIETGRMSARKVNGKWVIDGPVTTSRRGRPLSERSRKALAYALRNRTLGSLTGQERARTADRIHQLRESRDPAQLLIDWWGPTAPAVTDFASSLVRAASAGDRDAVREAIHRTRYEYLRDRHDLADVVMSERSIRKWTRGRLAEAAGVDIDQVKKMETSTPMESPAAMRKVLNAIEIEPTALPALVTVS